MTTVPAYSRIVLFGDSLSDQGKMFEKMHRWLPASPYKDGRYSDGPIWVDALPALLDGVPITNEAEGGATIYPYNTVSWDPTYRVVTNLDAELKGFLKKDKFTSSDLVILWLGGNDYLTFKWNTDADVERAVTHLFEQMDKMVAEGAKNFAIFNLPDFALIPAATHYGIVAVASHASQYHNSLVASRIASLPADRTVRLYDIKKQFDAFLSAPEQYGITDVKTPCYTGGFWWNPEGDTMSAEEAELLQKVPLLGDVLAARADLLPADECDKHFFYDRFHPNTAMHGVLAGKIASFLRENFEYRAK